MGETMEQQAELVELVAKALYDARGVASFPWETRIAMKDDLSVAVVDLHRFLARAAIATMREVCVERCDGSAIQVLLAEIDAALAPDASPNAISGPLAAKRDLGATSGAAEEPTGSTVKKIGGARDAGSEGV